MVGAAGFEPATFCTPCNCATELRHAPMDPSNLRLTYDQARIVFWSG